MNIEHGKSHWTDGEQDTLRSSIREMMTAHGLSQADISRESTIPGSTLSQFLSNTYKGDTQKIAKDLSRWLTAKHEEIRVAAVAPPEPTFTRTKTADQVIGVLRTAQALADIGLVVGPPGVGKTAAARQYQATSPRVAIATGSPAISTASAILQQLIRSRGDTPRGRSGASKLELTTHARRLFTAGWLIVIDEAQHLAIEALEELRAIHDETGVGIVLMGNDTVLTRIEGNERSAAFAQLYSRAGVRVRLKGTLPEDIDAVLGTMQVTESGVISTAKLVGAKDNLRVVVKAVRRAQMIAAGDRENLSPDHLRLAYRQLGGALVR